MAFSSYAPAATRCVSWCVYFWLHGLSGLLSVRLAAASTHGQGCVLPSEPHAHARVKPLLYSLMPLSVMLLVPQYQTNVGPVAYSAKHMLLWQLRFCGNLHHRLRLFKLHPSSLRRCDHFAWLGGLRTQMLRRGDHTWPISSALRS